MSEAVTAESEAFALWVLEVHMEEWKTLFQQQDVEANQQCRGEKAREKRKKEGANKSRMHKARYFTLLKKVRDARTGDATGKGWERVLQERALDERTAKAAAKKKTGEESKVDAENNDEVGEEVLDAQLHRSILDVVAIQQMEQRKAMSDKGQCRTNWFLNSVTCTGKLNCVKSMQHVVVEGVRANKPNWNSIKL